jgi:hypothetical protein
VTRVEGLTPAQAAAAVKAAVGQWGFDWMADADLRARAKDELGLRGRPMYHLGRAGVLGDVPVEVVIAVEAFFPPDVVRRAWEDGRALVEPHVAAAFYADGCAQVARRRFADDERTARAVALVEAVVDFADPTGLPLFAGWRRVARPDDAPGRLGVLLNVLREHRGAVHVAAVAAMGIPPLAAIMAGTYGEANARFFEWPEPYPDPAMWRGRWDAAEDLTASAAGRPYDALHADERQELADLVAALLP